MKKYRFHYGVQPFAAPTMQSYAKAMCFEKRVCSTDPFIQFKIIRCCEDNHQNEQKFLNIRTMSFLISI